MNNTDQYITLRVYAVDAVATANGDFNLAEEKDEKKGVAAWINLGLTEIIVEYYIIVV